MKCPNCNATLVMSDRQGIEIDYCPDCRGVWLDRGELDKIIERSATASPRRSDDDDDRRRSDSDHSRSYDYKKKRKSVLGEIFDF